MQKLYYPRWLAFILWPLTLLLGHAGLPAGLANLTRRTGWNNNQPGAWNILGLLLVVPGFLCLGWCAYLHFVRSSRTIEVVMAAPPELLIEGPYKWSRNPMYVAGMVIWSGWVFFYGSLGVLAGMLPFWSAIALLGVPQEERRLEAQFGESYTRYKRTVPRWLGRPINTGC